MDDPTLMGKGSNDNDDDDDMDYMHIIKFKTSSAVLSLFKFLFMFCLLIYVTLISTMRNYLVGLSLLALGFKCFIVNFLVFQILIICTHVTRLWVQKSRKLALVAELYKLYNHLQEMHSSKRMHDHLLVYKSINMMPLDL